MNYSLQIVGKYATYERFCLAKILRSRNKIATVAHNNENELLCELKAYLFIGWLVGCMQCILCGWLNVRDFVWLIEQESFVEMKSDFCFSVVKKSPPQLSLVSSHEASYS